MNGPQFSNYLPPITVHYGTTVLVPLEVPGTSTVLANGSAGTGTSSSTGTVQY
jgi:hypothetical protein